MLLGRGGVRLMSSAFFWLLVIWRIENGGVVGSQACSGMSGRIAADSAKSGVRRGVEEGWG